jgi:ankyrin repeat protein
LETKKFTKEKFYLHEKNGRRELLTFRKFAAENALQPQVQFEQSLTDRFNSGLLQNDVLVKEINPHTMIHKAILENSPVVIKFLLAQGVSVDYPDENGMSPLTIAILNRCDYAVEVLLDHGANTNPSVKWNSKNLLEIAMDMNDIDATMLLVQYGADVNIKDESGYGILLKTIWLASQKCMGNVNDRENAKKWVDIAKEMVVQGASIYDSSPNNIPFFAAIDFAKYSGDKSLVQLFIKQGANVNMVQKTKNGQLDLSTPLLQAIWHGDLSMVQLLISSGADINKKIVIDHAGKIRTPLNFALDANKPEIVQYLLQHGAKA